MPSRKSILLLLALLSLAGRALASTAIGSITITGAEQSSGPTWDTGTVTAIFNGVSVSYTYGQFSSPASAASALGALISNNCNMPVYAQANGATLTFYQKGSNTITSATITSASGNQSLFPGSSFQISGTGAGGTVDTVTVKVNLDSDTYNQGVPVTLTVTVGTLLGTVDPTAICPVTPGGPIWSVPLTVNGNQASGMSQFSTASLQDGFYTVTCTATASNPSPFGPLRAGEGTDSNTFTVTGTAPGCTATEGTPVDIAESDHSQTTFTTTWSLPFTLDPGGDRDTSTTGNDLGDHTQLPDCDNEEIIDSGDYHYSSVRNDIVQPGLQSVRLKWAVYSFIGNPADGRPGNTYWAGAFCVCGSGDCACDSNGFDPSTVTARPAQLVPYAITAECTQ